MERLAQIEAHAASMDGLLEVVGAMRSLAGMRLQEAGHGLAAARRYAQEIRGAIAAALPLLPEPRRPARAARPARAIVLCCAEHGFVGDFNLQLARSAQARVTPQDELFVIGTRGAAAVSALGLSVSWRSPQATRMSNAPQTALHLSNELYQRLSRQALSRIELIYGRYQPGRRSAIEQRTLVPLDWDSLARSPVSVAPLSNLPPARLVDELTAEYVFALLTEAILESLASENAARFAAMESAHGNISRKLEQLRREASVARQAEITTELLDVVTGAEALMSR
jgi:F-type H+-transporting ATPase subunit gamma